MRRRVGRWSYIVYAGSVLAILLIAVSVFAVVTVRRPLPDTSGTVRISDLRGEVEVVRDEQGIPQIYADDALDLFAAQGYVQAQDRFFEMDFRRHVTSGRLSELFGRSALETDEFVRTLGWRRVAQKELSGLNADTRRYLAAYARGVNEYIHGKDAGELSLEYSVLELTGPDYRPEPWTAADSVAWLKAMAWDLRSNMTDEIDRVLSTDKLDRNQVDQLYPGFPYDIHDPTVTSGTVRRGSFDQDAGSDAGRDAGAAGATARQVRAAVAPLKDVASVAAGLPRLLGTGDGIGSNAWAVSGERSATGHPLLANDPHLAPSMPGIWYQMGLHCRTKSKACPFDVSGFTFSGMPGVVIGHNDRVAMGITTMYPDVTDLYLEKVSGDTYAYNGKRLPLAVREERFEIAGEDDPVTITVRSTRHGPILSDIDETIGDVGERARAGGSYAVALRWTALRPGRTMDALFAIDRAQNWKQFRAAARLFDVPSQNMVYADTSGHIGYQAPGLVPIRGKGDGRWPVPGWDPAYEWKGYIPFEQMPSVLDPEKGYIVTSNQQVIGPQYPYLIGTGQAPGYRSQRIIDLIEHAGKLSVRDMAAMQTDTYNANAATIVPHLLDLPVGGEYYRDGLDLLRDWDFTQPPDSAAAAYFNVLWRNLLALTFHDQLPREVWPDGGERWFEVVRRILDDPASPWWDDITTKVRQETRDEILTRAVRDARDEMTRRVSLYPSRWSWGTLHRLTLTNQSLGTSGISLVEKLFNRGPYELGGAGGVVDATAWDAAEGYDVVAVPSMRMVVDMQDFDRSRWIQLTGESGHAFDDHYVDQTKLWAAGETLPWAYSRAAVRSREEDQLMLTPRQP